MRIADPELTRVTLNLCANFLCLFVDRKTTTQLEYFRFDLFIRFLTFQIVEDVADPASHLASLRIAETACRYRRRAQPQTAGDEG